ncbi:MAG: hypothetical protein HN509_14295 [Halobacteriovoraceae bacterium]|nr:hypothetical protein [Halobacteriovoraceae bacterium]MBT5095839.1 hypothetical protein [Halobacteriovoraceae bacterium]
MKNRIIAAALAFGLSASAFAASTATNTSTASGSFLSMLREAPVSALLLSDNFIGKNDSNDLVDFGQENRLYLGYNLSKKTNIRIDSGFAISANQERRRADLGTAAQYSGTTVRIKRTLSDEKTAGIGTSGEVRVNDFDGRYEDNSNLSGSVSTRLNLNKGFGKFNLASTIRYDRYMKRTGGDKALRTSKTNIYLTPSYAISDKITVANLFYFQKAYNEKNDNQENISLRLVPSVAVSWTKRFATEFYYDTTPFVSNDQQTFRSNWWNKGSYGVTATYAAF